MKCSIMLHFIWVFTVCISTCTCSGVSRIQRLTMKQMHLINPGCGTNVLWEKLDTCGSVVAHSLFIVASNVCGVFVSGLCFVIQYSVSFLALKASG